MELTRGVCVLCMNCTKVILPSQASNITKLLPEMLQGFIDVKKFDSVTSESLKICPPCLQDILNLKENRKHVGDYLEIDDKCSVCQCEENIVSITEWSHFDSLIGNINVERKRKYFVCLKCIKYLDVLHRIKTNFLKKYPQLAVQGSPKKNAKDVLKQVVMSNKNELLELQSKENYHDKLKNTLKHLKPLQLLDFNLNDYQDDKKLFNQVAFVKLSILNDLKKHGKINNKNLKGSNDTETSQKHSFFKIRLKPSGFKKNAEKTKVNRVPTRKIEKISLKPKLFSHKELIVNLLRLDLGNMKGDILLSSAGRSAVPLTPTKASRKLIEEPLSSSKKRKSVTFAPNINEIMDGDGASNRKESSAISPIKSLLKKSYSPSPDLVQTESVDKDNELVSSNKNSVDSDSDEECDKRDTFTEHIKENSDSIFESLKCIESRVSPERQTSFRDHSSDSENENENQKSPPEENSQVSDRNDHSESNINKDSSDVEENSTDIDRVDAIENQDEEKSSQNGIVEENSEESEESQDDSTSALKETTLDTNWESEYENTSKRQLGDDSPTLQDTDNEIESQTKKSKLNEFNADNEDEHFQEDGNDCGNTNGKDIEMNNEYQQGNHLEDSGDEIDKSNATQNGSNISSFESKMNDVSLAGIPGLSVVDTDHSDILTNDLVDTPLF